MYIHIYRTAIHPLQLDTYRDIYRPNLLPTISKPHAHIYSTKMEKGRTSSRGSSRSASFPRLESSWNLKAEEESPKGNFFERTMDGFRRDPARLITGKGVVGADGKVFDVEAANQATADTGLSRKLKGRHLQMIAIGGSIGTVQRRRARASGYADVWCGFLGTGLFVGSGKALSNGGPAALLIAFSLVGVMLYCTVHALGEMAVAFPVAGSFSAYSTRFLDPAWGFAMGWNYALQWLVVLPLEIVAASITIDYWGSPVSNAVWVTIFLTVIVSINLFGVKGYAEAEFIFAIIKVIAVIGFM